MLKRSEALPKVKEWIEANFEDKKGGCVAKRDIFDAYVAFCRAHNYQTTNDATFGKIFKTIFPHVQVRRLVRRVKAKKWHYCDVAYRQDSPLAIGAGPALSATAVATTDDDDCCSDDSGVTAQRRTKAAARCSGGGRGQPKKRKRSTSAAQKKGHLSDDEEVEQEETDASEKNKKRLRGEEEEEHDDDNDDDDGDYVEQEQPSLMVQAPEEDEVDGGTPSAGATSIWSDSEDESSSSSSSSCYASPSLPDTASKPAVAEIKHEEDKDLLQSSTDTPVSHTPSERAPVPTCLATSTTGLSLCGGDIDLSASSVIRVSSMLHSSSAFPLLVGTSAGLPPFGPATKRLDDSSELGSEAPPSLTSSSAEMFFSYQPASSTALADFVKAEPREEAEAEPEEKPARRHPPTPMMAASTVDREQIAPHAVAAAPPAIAPAYAHAHHAHTFPAHYPTHESAAAPAEPSPFEASRNLPIHSQTMTSLLLAHGHTTTSTFSMPTPASYAYAPAPQLIHASSTASANQASAFLPGQQHYQHGHQHQHQHQHHQHQHQHQHQHHSHQHQQHQQFAYPPYPIAPHPPPPFVTTASATMHPSWPQQTTNHQTTGHQTDREMSPESVEIFISHLLTDKSGEVMTLRPQQ